MEKGEYIGIMGASGSGKTTLLNCISTIDRATSGSIYIRGTDITSLNAQKLSRFRREELGFIFQDFNLPDTLTGRENIALSLAIKGEAPEDVDQRILEAARDLEIEKILDKYSYEMSGGQRRRSFPQLPSLYRHVYYNRNVFMDSGTLIVPGPAVQSLAPVWTGCAGMFQYEDSYDAFLKAYLNTPEDISFHTSRDIVMEVTSGNLSSLFIQLNVYFGLPLTLAVVNAAFIIRSVYRSLSEPGVLTILETIAFSGGLSLAVYGLYYATTCVGSKRILTLDSEKRKERRT